MKSFILGLLVSLFSSLAFGATTVPVQLLNPAGSSSGQAIVSTGSGSAPAWAAVSATSLASQAANTVVANFTGSSASPTAFAMPGCTGAANALGYTLGTGIVCNSAINAATLSGNAIGVSGAAVPLLNGANTWSGAQAFSSTITPSQTAGIVGTTTNNNANAGSVGEYITNSTSGTSLSTGVAANCTSASLTAGDWDVSGSIQFTPNTSTTVAAIAAGVNTTSATFAGVGTFNSLTATMGVGPTTEIMSSPVSRVSIASTTTVFLVGQASFGTSTMTCNGFIRARRVR